MCHLECWSQNWALSIQVSFPLNRQPIGRALTKCNEDTSHIWHITNPMRLAGIGNKTLHVQRTVHEIIYLTEKTVEIIISNTHDRVTDWLTDWLTDWMTWLSSWLSGWLTDGWTDWPTDWLTDRLIDWLTHWLTDWLTHWLTHWWLTHWLPHSLTHPNLVTCLLVQKGSGNDKLDHSEVTAILSGVHFLKQQLKLICYKYMYTMSNYLGEYWRKFISNWGR